MDSLIAFPLKLVAFAICKPRYADDNMKIVRQVALTASTTFLAEMAAAPAKLFASADVPRQM